MEKSAVAVLAVLTILFLSACGGGGGGGSETLAPANSPATTTKTFSVNLSSVEVRRVSTGVAIPVDVTGMTSGELTLTQ